MQAVDGQVYDAIDVFGDAAEVGRQQELGRVVGE